MAKSTPFDEQANDYDAWFDAHRAIYLAELSSGVEIGVGSIR